MLYPGRVLTFFVIPWGYRIWFSSPVFLLYRFPFRMFSCSYFILLCYRYLLLWVWVFCKLRRLSGQSAEAKAQAYGVSFEGVGDIGKLFDGLQQMSRVRVLGVPVFPVGPMDRALYLQSLLQSSKWASAINCAFYAFKWLHQVAGVDSPTLHPAVITAKDGAVRLV